MLGGDEGSGGEVRRLFIDKAHYTNCKLPPTFYVKKYFVAKGENPGFGMHRFPFAENAIFYIASSNEEHLDNDDPPEDIVRNDNSYLSARTCVIGKSRRSSYVRTNVNAKRCGLATVLTYLCYLDREHEPSIMGAGVGYDFELEMSTAPHIFARQAVTKLKDYVNRKCARVIKVITVANPSVAGRGYVQAAKDAGYHVLVTFNTNNPFEKINKKDIETLVWEFVDNPVRIEGSKIVDPVLDLFIERRGNNWFFCKVDVCSDVL